MDEHQVHVGGAEANRDDLSPPEVRVLGCLIEKEATVPDSYPLTLNSLRIACNQSTSRDPVVSYGDHEVERALASLRARGLTRTVHSTSNRAAKYRHVVPDAFGLGPGETALLSVLMLRGPQTVGELKARCERQHSFGSTDEVAAALAGLAGRPTPLVRQLGRQPGQKDARWVHLLAPVDVGEPAPPVSERAESERADAEHLTVVFDHGRVRIELGARPGGDPDDIEMRISVRAEPLGGTITATLGPSDLERFVADLERVGQAGRVRLGGGVATLVELRSEVEGDPGSDAANDAASGWQVGVSGATDDVQIGARGEPPPESVIEVGARLTVECSIVVTEDDPREWLQFVMAGVPPFAAETAARVRAVLAETG